jgi:hypothetical protein
MVHGGHDGSPGDVRVGLAGLGLAVAAGSAVVAGFGVGWRQTQMAGPAAAGVPAIRSERPALVPGLGGCAASPLSLVGDWVTAAASVSQVRIWRGSTPAPMATRRSRARL